MLINIEDAWNLESKRKHAQYMDDVLNGKLPPRNPIMNSLLLSHAEKLALAPPQVLHTIISDVQQWKMNYSPGVYQEFIADSKLLFDYGRFSNKLTKGWNAYALCKGSKYKMCPYCQQAAAVTIFRDRDGKAFRPTLDHFYAKHIYPYLALSLYNLVPSCHVCNSSLKGEADFFNYPHLHPYEDNEVVRYSFDIQSYVKRRKLKGDNTPPNVHISLPLRGDVLHKRARRSLNTFLLSERLSLNEPEIHRFVDVLMTYSDGRLEEVNQKIFSNSSWRLTEVAALNFSYADYKNEWLGRLKRDLYEAAWTRKNI